MSTNTTSSWHKTCLFHFHAYIVSDNMKASKAPSYQVKTVIMHRTGIQSVTNYILIAKEIYSCYISSHYIHLQVWIW